jgi:hypothetical protein
MLDPALCAPSVSMYVGSAWYMEIDTYENTSVEWTVDLNARETGVLWQVCYQVGCRLLPGRYLGPVLARELAVQTEFFIVLSFSKPISGWHETDHNHSLQNRCMLAIHGHAPPPPTSFDSMHLLSQVQHRLISQENVHESVSDPRHTLAWRQCILHTGVPFDDVTVPSCTHWSAMCLCWVQVLCSVRWVVID